MPLRLQRVGTIYLPVTNPKRSAEWFCANLGAELDYMDEGNNHAIISLARQSFILIQSEPSIVANLQTINDGLMFPFTFEVNGESELVQLHKELKDRKCVLEKLKIGVTRAEIS
jgi:hypothetical protein